MPPLSRQAVPWRIYLLIDPTTGPTNHPLGTIFYIGLRHELPEPVDLREATEPQSIPQGEVAARERLEHLNREGARALVEVVPEQGWSNADSGHLDRTVGVLCACLHPAPLNVRHKSIRWSGSLARAVERAEVVPLPDGGAIIRKHQGSVEVATLPLLDPDELFEQHIRVVEGRTSPRKVSKELAEGGPLPLLLVTEGRKDRGVISGDFVLGVWVAETVEPVDEGRTQWQVILHSDPELVGALRRRYLHQRVDLGDPRALKLRKA